MLPIGSGNDDVEPKQGPSRMVSQLLQLLNPATKLPSAVSAVGHCDHPLDPLTAEEVNATSDACKAYAAKLGIQGLRFNAIALEVTDLLSSSHPEHQKVNRRMNLPSQCRNQQRLICCNMRPPRCRLRRLNVCQLQSYSCPLGTVWLRPWLTCKLSLQQ